VRGELLKAFHSAYTAFLRNKAYPSDRKNVANYDVSFTETPENTVVVFAETKSPRAPVDGRPYVAGAASRGQ